MTLPRIFAAVVLSLVSASLGWKLNSHFSGAASARSASEAPLGLSAVAPARVAEKAPLPPLLDCPPQAPAAARQAEAPVLPAHPHLPSNTPEPEQNLEDQAILDRMRSSSESARYDALLQARSSGTVVPDEMLKQMFELDNSDAVRLLAFEHYLERRSGSATEVRAVLEAALRAPSVSIQTEAQTLLEQLEAQERTTETADTEAQSGF